MTPTTYQKPEIRDANDNIIQQGAFGKNTALSNATNDGWIDYVANDLEALKSSADSSAPINSPAFTGTPTAPTQTASDDSTKIATTEFVHDNTDNKLPLAGGTMTGAIIAPSVAMKKSNTNGQLDIYSGTTWNDGAWLSLYGGTSAGDGHFLLGAYKNGSGSGLIGYPNGALTWGGNNVITSAGGTFTGDIVYSHKYSKLRNSYTNNEGSISINGGDSDNDGAKFIAYGKNYNGGKFTASANNGTNSSILEGTANGTLTWAGQNVLTASNYNSYALPLSGGTINGTVKFSTDNALSRNTTDGEFIIYGGEANFNSPCIALRGQERTTDAGTLYIRVKNTSQSKDLIAKPDGTLKWGGNNVITSAGGTFTGGVTFNNQATTFAEKYAKLQSGYSNDEGLLSFNGGNGDNTGARLVMYGKNYGSTGGGGALYFNVNNGTATKTFQAKPDGTLTWNGQPIQTSSDKRLKQDFADVPADVLEAWGKVNWQQFKYIDDAERKGVNNCRFHTGLVAQDVKEIGEENNVDLLKYGILCHDVREAVEEEKDEDGNVIKEASEAVDLWTIRYEEALAMEAAYQRRRADRLEERIARLEALLDK